MFVGWCEGNILIFIACCCCCLAYDSMKEETKRNAYEKIVQQELQKLETK